MADRPNGKLTTGGVGGILLCAAFALMLITTLTAGGMGMGVGMGSGILGLLAFVLLIGGGICAGLGLMGLGKIYGGSAGLGGVFTLIMGIMPVVVFLLGIILVSSASSGGMSAGGAQGAGIIIVLLTMGSFALAGIFGGLGVMGAKAGLAKPAGILLLVGGIASAVALLGAFVALPQAIGTIVGIAMSGGFAGGFLLAGLTMFAERA